MRNAYLSATKTATSDTWPYLVFVGPDSRMEFPPHQSVIVAADAAREADAACSSIYLSKEADHVAVRVGSLDQADAADPAIHVLDDPMVRVDQGLRHGGGHEAQMTAIGGE